MMRFTSLFRFFLLVLCCSPIQFAFGQGIDFLHLTWIEALVKSKKENKPIFLDVYAPWCGPCKQMKKRIFTDAQVGQFFNQRFICVRIDIEEANYFELNKNIKISSFPSLLFLDKKGQILHQICGYRNAEHLIQDAKTALNPKERLQYEQLQFKQGNRAENFLRNHIQSSIRACLDPSEIVRAYWETQDTDRYTSRFNWMLYLKFVKDIHSKQFIYLLKNLNQFRQIYGDDPDAYIVSVYKNALSTSGKKYWKAVSNKDKEAEKILHEYERCKKDIQAQNYPKSHRIIDEFDLLFYDHLGWYEAYAKTASRYVSRGMDQEHKADKLNQIAWKYYEHIHDPKDLHQALNWIETSLKIREAYANLDTYAALLFKTGNLKKGEKIALKAIEIAKKHGQNYTATKNLLKKYLK